MALSRAMLALAISLALVTVSIAQGPISSPPQSLPMGASPTPSTSAALTNADSEGPETQPPMSAASPESSSNRSTETPPPMVEESTSLPMVDSTAPSPMMASPPTMVLEGQGASDSGAFVVRGFGTVALMTLIGGAALLA